MRRAIRALFTAVMFPVMYYCVQTFVAQGTMAVFAVRWTERYQSEDMERLSAAWSEFYKTSSVFIMAGAALLTLLVLFLLMKRTPGGLLGQVGCARPKLTVMGLSAVCGLAAHMAVRAVLGLMSLPQYVTEEHNEILEQLSGGGVAANLLVACLLLPIVEEMVFRGMGQRALQEVFSPRVAVLISAILFAGFHFNPMQIFYAFLLGLILGAVYYWTRNILVPIFMHVAFNTGNYLASWVFAGVSREIELGLILLVGTGAVVGGLSLMHTLIKGKSKPKPEG